jgi:hypothetical protein
MTCWHGKSAKATISLHVVSAQPGTPFRLPCHKFERLWLRWKMGFPPARERRSIGEEGGTVQRALIVVGLALLVAGLVWPWLRKLPLGRLPGDIHVVREGFSFHFPIVTCLAISVVLSILLWLFRR